jgi:hypothetical protein
LLQLNVVLYFLCRLLIKLKVKNKLESEMKKIFMLFLLLIASISVYSQQPEWRVFTAPPLPAISILPDNNILPIELNGNSDKEPGTFTGLAKFDLTNVFASNSKYSQTLPDNFIVCMAVDNRGNIWFGTYFGGLAKFDGTNWTVYDTSNSSLPSNTIFSLSIESNGHMWIGTTAGLIRYNGTNWTLFNTSNSGLRSNIIYSLVIDEMGNKWIGTTAGLAIFNGKTWKVYNTRNSKLPSNYVSALAIDRNGNKWIGTYEGLVKYDGKNWKIFKTSNSGLPFNDIYSISLEGSNKMLIETWGGGLAGFDGKKWLVYKTSNSGLPDNYVSSLVNDGKGNKWIGTLGGLAKFNGENWTVFNTSNSSLPDNRIYSLAIDKTENLWIGTQNGLALFKEGKINSTALKLLTFFSIVKDNSVTLNWQSKTEVNNYGFEIEKKTNSSSWEKIGFVKGNGNSSSSIKYSFIDQHSISGKILYRLKQIDYYGKHKYSNIIDSFVGIPSTYYLEQIFPNKHYPTIKINFGLPENIFTRLVVYDLLGREIKTLINADLKAGYYEVEFRTINLPSGTYFYRFQTKNFTSIKKLFLLK